ncbi:MAG TPA: isocitrate lyase/phosphoenolpyruvate mutase family protein [Chloroflexota bacterium]|nr:isocitrate lyase/phosphoenolpyruvate mutase family protein [Chloroflexota bacterium]
MTTVSPEVLAAANAHSRRLRELLNAPEILVMPGAYDVLSARLFESMGFPAIQGTSGGINAVYGLQDEELLGLERTADIYREITAAVSVPVNADGEKGYGGPEQIPDTVRQYVSAGLAGMNLEDSDYHPRGTPMRLIPLDIALAKIKAVMDTKRELGSEFFLNARVDEFGTVSSHQEGMAEAIKRGNAYAEAGADCIFFLRPGDRSVIETLVREIKAPVSVLAGPDTPPIRELADIGVGRVSYGASFSRVAITAVARLADELLTGGDPRAILNDAMPRDRYLKLLRDHL